MPGNYPDLSWKGTYDVLLLSRENAEISDWSQAKKQRVF